MAPVSCASIARTSLLMPSVNSGGIIPVAYVIAANEIEALSLNS